MSQPMYAVPCPNCGTPTPQDTRICPVCNPAANIPQFRPAYPMPQPHAFPQGAAPQPPGSDQFEATDLLIPRGVSTWSMAACYLGLIGMCLPVVGFPLALFALICSIVAITRRKKSGSYGAVTGDIRAIVGLVFGLIGTVGWGIVLIMMAASSMH